MAETQDPLLGSREASYSIGEVYHVVEFLATVQGREDVTFLGVDRCVSEFGCASFVRSGGGGEVQVLNLRENV